MLHLDGIRALRSELLARRRREYLERERQITLIGGKEDPFDLPVSRMH